MTNEEIKRKLLEEQRQREQEASRKAEELRRLQEQRERQKNQSDGKQHGRPTDERPDEND